MSAESPRGGTSQLDHDQTDDANCVMVHVWLASSKRKKGPKQREKRSLLNEDDEGEE
eukprot:CAMPEP_0184672868 /NCGR_PEP_ID=MMETSP0308-20130426/86353_1 /TAXON_ID=38269 /ORGANISM="Gloeochaete witrockiana, Strain SAG 46.84" /LENGTH=56 /DNA_ID=CAMNT_0027120273 /DNA_START=42 /DNA_END=212 /DNA_ORIENTATION=-